MRGVGAPAPHEPTCAGFMACRGLCIVDCTMPALSLIHIYQLEWHNPREPARVDSYTSIGDSNGFVTRAEADLGEAGAGADIAAGQTLTANIGLLGPPLTHGMVHGTITLYYSTGPSVDGELPTKKIPVGSFTATIP